LEKGPFFQNKSKRGDHRVISVEKQLFMEKEFFLQSCRYGRLQDR